MSSMFNNKILFCFHFRFNTILVEYIKGKENIKFFLFIRLILVRKIGFLKMLYVYTHIHSN